MKTDLYYTYKYLNSDLSIWGNRTFEFKVSEAESEYSKSFITGHVIVLFLNGQFRIASHCFDDQYIHQYKMVFLAQGDSYKIVTSKKSCILFIHLKATSPYIVQLLNKDFCKDQILCGGYVLSIKEPIQDYINLLYLYFSENLNCKNLLELKKEEFFFLLDLLYSKKSLVYLFYSPHNTYMRRKVILRNFAIAHNTTEANQGYHLRQSISESLLQREPEAFSEQ